MAPPTDRPTGRYGRPAGSQVRRLGTESPLFRKFVLATVSDWTLGTAAKIRRSGTSTSMSMSMSVKTF